MLKPKYISTTIQLDEKMWDRLNDAAEKFGVTKIRLIRLCLDAELPRIIDRESKRTRRRTTEKQN